MGTPDFSAHILGGMVAAGYHPVAVYTQPDRPAGRGRRASPPPVKALAVQHGIPVHQPQTLKDTEVQRELAAYQPDVIVVVAFGLLLPEPVLAIPPLGCINVHASLLPRWRGAAPIQRAIEAGDRETGVCLMQMEAGLDTGPVLASRTVPITVSTTGGSLHDELSELGSELLLETLPDLKPVLRQSVAQNDALATYAGKLSKADGHLDFSRPASELERRIRAFNPWPVAWFELGGQRFRIWSARTERWAGRIAPGTVVMDRSAGMFGIAAADDLLVPTRLQAPGRKPVTLAEWLNGQSGDDYSGMKAN